MNKKDDNLDVSKEGKRDVALNSLLQLIPSVGSALANAYFGYKQEKRFQRLENFYNELSSEIQDKRLKLVDFDKHDKEILISLVEELNEQVEKEALEEKKVLLKNYFKSLLTDPTKKNNYDLRKFFLYVLNKLSLIDINLIAELQNKQATLISALQLTEKNDIYLVYAAVSKLESFALITTAQNNYVLYPDAEDNFDDERDYKLIKLSELGEKFIDFCLE